MKKRILWLILGILMVLSLIMASCTTEKSTSTTTTKTSATTQTTATTQTSTSIKTTTTSSATTTVQTTTATQVNWWDKFGTPQYGGTMTFAPQTFSEYFDWYLTQYSLFFYFQEPMWITDWKLDRNTWSFSTPYVPAKYYQGLLVESWEWPDLSTCIVRIRKGITWQDKAPLNGREFTAYDVQAHYDRLLGTGSGYTSPAPMYAGRVGALKQVTATDKYAATIKFSSPGVLNFLTLLEQSGTAYIEPPEVAKPGAPLNDWKNAVGTGPWIVADYVTGSSLSLNKNTRYWGYDERYPKNQLPYADKLVVLRIPDIATRVAALRSGQIDFTTQLNFRYAGEIAKSNPEIKQARLPYPGDGLTIRVDVKPFSNVKVRKAMEMCLDRKTIAATYFGGTLDGTPVGRINPANKGYAFAYEDWPQSIKNEYSYNVGAARALMTEAGYPNGFKTNCVGDAGNMDSGLAQIFQAYLKDIGIEMQISVMESTAYQAFTRGRLYDQMLWSTGTAGFIVDPVFAVGFGYSKNTSNFSNVNDPDYDATYLKLQSAPTVDDVSRLVTDLDRRIIEGHWNLNTFSSAIWNMSQPYIKGYNGENMVRSGDPGGWFWARLWIDKSLKK